MPEFLSAFSRSEAYFIMLIENISGVPAVLLGSKLIETQLGRKYTATIAFSLAGICCYLFYVDNGSITVKNI